MPRRAAGDAAKTFPQMDNFLQYQQVLRDLRSDLQRDAYAEPLLARFPAALVGNYAIYPHNGFRYWYDYFEKSVQGQPALVDQKARYRHWANEFESTGYTFAMPVVYTWSWTYHWYDFLCPTIAGSTTCCWSPATRANTRRPTRRSSALSTGTPRRRRIHPILRSRR